MRLGKPAEPGDRVRHEWVRADIVYRDIKREAAEGKVGPDWGEAVAQGGAEEVQLRYIFQWSVSMDAGHICNVLPCDGDAGRKDRDWVKAEVEPGADASGGLYDKVLGEGTGIVHGLHDFAEAPAHTVAPEGCLDGEGVEETEPGNLSHQGFLEEREGGDRETGDGRVRGSPRSLAGGAHRDDVGRQ